jgi:peptidoglycan/xylan/chitin deacetylase (PgdA/CDA1 family)
MKFGLPRVLFALLCLLPLVAGAQAIGLSFDDGLDPSREPRAAQWNARLLHALGEQQLHAIVFPALRRIGGDAGMALIEDWSAAGHVVGNHTAEHRNLSSPEVTLDAFTEDVERAERAFQHLPAWQPLLRFPYLKEGDTAAKRDGMRAWMHEHGYRVAPVSIDTSDWYYNERYLALRAAGRSEPVKRLLRAYVRHLLDRASYYDVLARRVLGRSPQHLMLLHTNAINAAALRDVVEAFRAKGWHFVAARSVLDDPLYAMQPEIVPAGESIIWALAKERGVEDLRYPAEDAAYERPILKRLGLAP